MSSNVHVRNFNPYVAAYQDPAESLFTEGVLDWT